MRILHSYHHHVLKSYTPEFGTLHLKLEHQSYAHLETIDFRKLVRKNVTNVIFEPKFTFVGGKGCLRIWYVFAKPITLSTWMRLEAMRLSFTTDSAPS